jgi:hypothetical protein
MFASSALVFIFGVYSYASFSFPFEMYMLGICIQMLDCTCVLGMCIMLVFFCGVCAGRVHPNASFYMCAGRVYYDGPCGQLTCPAHKLFYGTCVQDSVAS